MVNLYCGKLATNDKYSMALELPWLAVPRGSRDGKSSDSFAPLKKISYLSARTTIFTSNIVLAAKLFRLNPGLEKFMILVINYVSM